MAVGLACWPLNQLDRWQDALLRSLPAFGILRLEAVETQQLLWAVPFGLLAGLLGCALSLLLLACSARFVPLAGAIRCGWVWRSALCWWRWPC